MISYSWFLLLGIMMLFAKIGHIATSEVIYITPSSPGQCSVEPCFTLSQFTSRYINSNKTLLKFLPGSHDLNSQIVISNVSQFSMVLSDMQNLNLMVATTVIQCTRFGGFQFTDVQSVVINGLKFISCGGSRIKFVNQLILQNSTFLGRENSETALELVHTSASIVRCSFINNTIGSFKGSIKILERAPSQHPKSAWCGGAIVASNSTVTISESVFNGNSATVGGAIFISSSNVTIINSMIMNCVARSKMSRSLCYGGAIHSDNSLSTEANIILANSTFINSSACYGGSISALNTNIKIENGSFHNHVGISGGAIFGLRIKLSVIDSSFTSNVAYQTGGTIVISNGSVANIWANEFIKNQGETSGVIYVYRSFAGVVNNVFLNNKALLNGGVLGAVKGNLTLQNNQFLNNSANQGGVVVSKTSTLIVDMSMLINNSVTSHCGGFFASASRLNISNSEFINNTAQNTGGVLCTDTESKLTIHNCQFLYNKARIGILSATYSLVTIIASEFSNNKAEFGGVFDIQLYSSLHVTNSTFMENTALDGGGVLYISGSNVTIEWTIFQMNIAKQGGVWSSDTLSNITIVNSTFSENTAKVGGGVGAMAYSSHVMMNGCHFNNNTAGFGGVLAGQVNVTVMITESDFFDNDATALGLKGTGGVITLLSDSAAVIGNSSFSTNRANRGGVVYIQLSSVDIKDSKLNSNGADFGGVLLGNGYATATVCNSELVNNVAQKNGGVVALQYDSNVFIMKSTLINNKAYTGGVTYLISYSTVTIKDSVLCNNSAVKQDDSVVHDPNRLHGYGGVIYSTDDCTLTIFNSMLGMNSASGSGGTIAAMINSTLIIRGSLFYNNSAPVGGSIGISEYSTLDIDNSSFVGNSASKLGGALSIYNTMPDPNISNSVFSYNSASFGTIFVTTARLTFSGKIEFSDNFGSVYAYSSNLYFKGSVIFMRCSATNSEETEGGAITAFQSTMYFLGSFVLRDNYANKGGAVHMIESRTLVYNAKDTLVANNTAIGSGGGFYLYRSQLICLGNATLILLGNKAGKLGGGIHAIGSTVSVVVTVVGTSLHFIENSATSGGGMCLEVDSKLYVYKLPSPTETSDRSITIFFTRNSAAKYGGAIHIVDSTYFGICNSNRFTIKRNQSTTVECFFQVLAASIANNSNATLSSIGFTDNYANVSGSYLFGGLLDRCTANPFAQIYRNSNDLLPDPNTPAIDGVTYFVSVSNVDKHVRTTGSTPVRVCFCRNNQPDCSYQQPTKEVMKGETFNLSLVAVDQVNHTLSDVTIHSSLKYKESGLGEGQLGQRTGNSCTTLTFTVTSPHPSEELIVYAEGPCKNANFSQNRINIHFKNCSCPIGFQLIESEQTNCVCECNAELLNCISDCNQQNETLVRNSSCWFDYFSNETTSEHQYIVYQYCPYDYCFPPESRTEINLNVVNGTEAQCMNNRSGVLCGSCRSGLSLSPGSSHCLRCPSYWSKLLVAYVLGAFVAGIVLVVLLLWLNLTVAIGTLNGILFYANIVAVNNTLSFTTPNFISVFLSWLNLELEVDVCLYEGMDPYSKTWIELIFPAYVIFLVVMVIFLSERFTKFGRVIGKKNPVATLATLILLSYTKFLRTIVASLSFAILDYPDGSREILWLPDATVKYLRGKHIALFITAIFILIGGVAYTVLLFSWQWLLYHQNKKIFRWVRNQKLCLFLEPYHAPYTFKHRYWTGLLLLIRVGLYITISVVNQTNDPAVNLLTTGTVMIGLIIAKGILGNSKRIYDNWLTELLEMMCYLNISLFSIAKLYILVHVANSDPINILGYISGAFTLFLFILVLLYHVLTEVLFKTNIWKKLKHRSQRNEERDNLVLSDYPPVGNDQRDPPEPTFSIVEAPSRGEGELLPLSTLVEAGLEKETVSDSSYKTSINNDNETRKVFEDDKDSTMNGEDVISVISSADSTSEVSPLIAEHS